MDGHRNVPAKRSGLGRRSSLRTAVLVVTAAACSPATPPPAGSSELSALTARIQRFAPVDIAADVAALPAREREALVHLVEAARLMDGLFLEQVWAGNPSLLTRLAGESSDMGRAELHYFLINKGPWSRLDHDEPFLAAAAGVPAKPPQANFYPADAAR
jgi:hypothetical protein